jgi:peroxiredoxin
VIGISADAPDRNLAWTKALKLPFRLGSDVDGRVSRQYAVWNDTWRLAQRVTFVVDRSRIIRYVEEGGLAIDTGRTLDAVAKLARAR